MLPPELLSALSGNESLDIGRFSALPVTENVDEPGPGTPRRAGWRRDDDFFEVTIPIRRNRQDPRNTGSPRVP
ncbi:hypothetical protein GDO81_024066 [Engystomops pustulosus]|uniref:Uncharacterized protein n=1 Tax=Engystomops pustulosus TaxID=76066 RepID=A0AAV6Z2A6_ENGPU|nr:hypothetical protein GDO81_024066 [Engystomops pustulosus]